MQFGISSSHSQWPFVRGRSLGGTLLSTTTKGLFQFICCSTSQKIVGSGLIDVRPPADHLRLVIDAARDLDVAQLPIYTLNHDCLIEDAFEAAGVPLFDFRRRDGSNRVLLDLDAPIPEGTRATLLKPHGSVRWRRFRPLEPPDNGDPWFSEWIGWHRCDSGKRHDDGTHWRSIGPPLILVGRFNKELDYQQMPYWQTFLALAQSLKTRRQVVVSGYGFGDKAINTLLINWLYEKPPGERRLIVLHQDKEELLSGARARSRTSGMIGLIVASWSGSHDSLATSCGLSSRPF